MTNPFVTEIDIKLAEKMIPDLQAQDFEISKPQYTIFSARKKGLTCTLYTSGKLVVQGKNTQEFMEFYLEPEILKDFSFTYKEELEVIDPTPRIGIDESGKGDFFGPLCIAGVYAGNEMISELKKMGVKDSKLLSDPMIIKIGNKIRAACPYSVIILKPEKYNELYEKFKNLNSLLAWGHASAIENLVKKTDCHKVIIDQFAADHVVIQALKKKEVEVDLTQRTKGEEDVVVAAASILARQAFVENLSDLGREYELLLPKGASEQVKVIGRHFILKHGKDNLHRVAKMHFKTLDSIL
jgi:ribonuclease HIII